MSFVQAANFSQIITFTIPPVHDAEGDGFPSSCEGLPLPCIADNCPIDYNPGQEDADNDKVGDLCDNTPNVIITNQTSGDNQAPIITIISPGSAPMTLDQILAIPFVTNIVDENLQGCWYSTDNGATKIAFACSSNVINNIQVLVKEGTNSWTVYANDSYGNTGIKSVVFTIIINNTIPGNNNNNTDDDNCEEDEVFYTNKNNYVQFCDVSWECTGWTDCNNGFMTRQCYDVSNCAYKYNKPLEIVSCDTNNALVEIEKPVEISYFFVWIFITMLLLVIAIILLMKLKG